VNDSSSVIRGLAKKRVELGKGPTLKSAPLRKKRPRLAGIRSKTSLSRRNYYDTKVKIHPHPRLNIAGKTTMLAGRGSRTRARGRRGGGHEYRWKKDHRRYTLLDILARAAHEELKVVLGDAF